MWDESLIESKTSTQEKKRWLGVPASIIFHVALVFALVSVSYWTMDGIAAVPLPVTFYGAVAPPPPIGDIHGRSATKSQQTAKPATPVQQSQAPNLDPEKDLPKSNDDQQRIESDEPQGDPNGVPGSYSALDALGTGVIGGSGTMLGTDEAPRVFSSEMSAPVLIHKVDPVYPAIARQAHVQGVVILQATITKTGSVEDVQLVRSDNALLTPAAMNAVLQWQYKPATINGRPITVYFSVTCRFILH